MSSECLTPASTACALDDVRARVSTLKAGGLSALVDSARRQTRGQGWDLVMRGRVQSRVAIRMREPRLYTSQRHAAAEGDLYISTAIRGVVVRFDVMLDTSGTHDQYSLGDMCVDADTQGGTVTTYRLRDRGETWGSMRPKMTHCDESDATRVTMPPDSYQVATLSPSTALWCIGGSKGGNWAHVSHNTHRISPIVTPMVYEKGAESVCSGGAAGVCIGGVVYGVDPSMVYAMEGGLGGRMVGVYSACVSMLHPDTGVYIKGAMIPTHTDIAQGSGSTLESVRLDSMLTFDLDGDLCVYGILRYVLPDHAPVLERGVLLRYDLQGGRWSVVCDRNPVLHRAAVVTVDRSVYLMGAPDTIRLGSGAAQLYCLDTKGGCVDWERIELPSLVRARCQTHIDSAVVVGRHVVVLTGLEECEQSCIAYDTVSGEWHRWGGAFTDAEVQGGGGDGVCVTLSKDTVKQRLDGVSVPMHVLGCVVFEDGDD
ncbi:hypothetical protein KIPB_010690 [Kipferlia bialata]|uniref:Uncharacterized protein n=1 Tax=Kipferlia bialata TaxID=797122 RepID=A0A9K3D4F6_9EUKA|nr:hypothetical protein KIPB_010690 [Kipferlia bialata]|eukprot:g10690.t1